MASKRQVDRDHKAQSRALVMRQQNDVLAPIIEQPAYSVPEADETLRAAQTTSWDTGSEIKILRYYLAKCALAGDNPIMAVQLTKAIDMMISRNQATALKCGAYLSREAITDFIKVLIQIACESIRERVPQELYEEIMDDMQEKIKPYFGHSAIAAANARHET